MERRETNKGLQRKKINEKEREKREREIMSKGGSAGKRQNIRVRERGREKEGKIEGVRERKK